MKRHFLYIINPISGTKSKSSLKELIEEQTSKAGYPFEIVFSVPTGDYRFLQPLIQQKNITDIIIAGGDGTISQVVGSLYQLQTIQFGIIPSGSGNGLGFTAGISKDPKKALKAVFKGTAKPTDAFFVNNRFACMLCGIGFDAQVAHDFARHGKRGLATYISKVWANFLKAATYPFTIIVNEQTISMDAYFISIANSNQFGNNFTIAPLASLTDGLLDVVIVAVKTKLSFVIEILKQVVGLNSLQEIEVLEKETGVLYFRAKNITILNTSLAPVHIDGEPVLSSLQIEIEIKQQAFQLIYP